MNYYEQFYDDLEFQESDPYYHDNREHHPGHYDYEEDWYHRDQGYRVMDHPDRMGRGHIRGPGDFDRERDHLGRSRGFPERGRGFSERGRGNNSERGRGSNSERGRGNSERGRGNSERGRGNISDRGRGNTERAQGYRGRGADRARGRGLSARGAAVEGKYGGFVNFVKAGNKTGPDQSSSQPTSDSGMDNSQNGKAQNQETGSQDGGSIRFDYKRYQSQPTSTQQEVDTALNVYQHPVLSSYGYGAGSGFEEFGAKSFDGMPLPHLQEMDQSEMPQHATPEINQSQPVLQTKSPPTITKPSPLMKKAMVNPSFNFVKAKAEFKSTDVAFHETEQPTEADKAQSGFVAANSGKKRAGLGMTNAGLSSANVSTKFHAGMKDNGANPQFDRKFEELHKVVLAKNRVPGKNGIEVLHMAVDKVKMQIEDDIKAGARTQAGQVRFVCELTINGVYLAKGIATAKKVAKHEAYTEAVKLLVNPGLTVREASGGRFELKQNDNLQFGGVPLSNLNKVAPKTGYTPSQGKQSTVQSNKSGLSSTGNVSYPTSHMNMNPAYTKPKMVFHKANHPMANAPLDFKKPDNPSFTQNTQTSIAAGAMATKLLNFVKEGTVIEEEQTDKKIPSTQQPKTATSSPNTNSSKHSPIKSTSSALKRPHQSSSNSSFGMAKSTPCKKRHGPSLDELSQFIIIDNTPVNPNNTPGSILHTSANFNKVVMKREFEQSSEGVLCTVIISDHVVCSTYGDTKDEAKIAAAEEAFKSLQEECYTIKIKSQVDADTSGLKKEELLGEIQKGGDVIPNSNIGNMLLRKMGWSGGGVGKDGKGIAEPISADHVIGREGLGLKAEKEKGFGKGFHEKVHKILTDYVKSNDSNDLHFTAELAKEERAIIHKMGQKMGLKTKSSGKDDNRFLVISRKRSAHELLEHVIENGGTTHKYEVVPPSNTDLAYDPRKRDALSYGHGKQ